ncbi:MAG: DUF3500 domain-containing protein [Pseudomonadota bacterium]
MDRRAFIAASAAASLAPSLVSAATGSSMRSAAGEFLATLDTPRRNAALFAFGARQRRAWNFMLGSRAAPGLALERMTPNQSEAALALLATGTSALGFTKARNIMLQQDILRDEWNKGAPDRNSRRFSVQIYGAPSATDPWSWRWEGHHLSLTFTVVGDEVVSTTPSAFSSEPNTVPSGPHRGLTVLKEEETLARRLFSDLSGDAREQALAFPTSPGNILSVRGAEVQVAREAAGIPLANLPEGQADMVRRLIEVYTTEVLPAPLARQQAARIRGEDDAAIRFAWGGADLSGSIYYRITGQNLLIEFATLRNQPQHLHAVFHDTARNFGAHTI